MIAPIHKTVCRPTLTLRRHTFHPSAGSHHPERAQRVEDLLYFAFALVLVFTCNKISPAQTAPYINRNVILLDPAHGGQDNGASIGDQAEKTITLNLAASLKTLLTSRGFTVATTRDADLPATTPLLTSDQRAGIANHLRPVACILLHVTNTGNGVHLSTSALEPSLIPYEPSVPVPWETAQSFYLPQSRRLANDLGLALLRARIPVLLSRAAVRPLDNLTCPAVAIEVAPLANSGQKSTPPTDAFYQQRIADILSVAILTWRDATLPRPVPKSVSPAGVTP